MYINLLTERLGSEFTENVARSMRTLAKRSNYAGLPDCPGTQVRTISFKTWAFGLEARIVSASQVSTTSISPRSPARLNHAAADPTDYVFSREPKNIQ